jgi:hypothetical protein
MVIHTEYYGQRYSMGSATADRASPGPCRTCRWGINAR